MSTAKVQVKRTEQGYVLYIDGKAELMTKTADQMAEILENAWEQIEFDDAEGETLQ